MKKKVIEIGETIIRYYAVCRMCDFRVFYDYDDPQTMWKYDPPEPQVAAHKHAIETGHRIWTEIRKSADIEAQKE